MNTLFPMFVNLKGKPCTVVGGGQVALRKILDLLDCHAAVRVIAPQVVPHIHQLYDEGRIEFCQAPYRANDVVGAFLVVAATNDSAVNSQIYQECTTQNILCNVVDQPELCNFYTASTYTCGDLKIAISTNGASPTLARKLKAELAERYPAAVMTPYLVYLKKLREAVKEKVAEESQRKQILEQIVHTSEVLEHCQDQEFCHHIETLDYHKEVEQWLSRSLE